MQMFGEIARSSSSHRISGATKHCYHGCLEINLGVEGAGKGCSFESTTVFNKPIF